MKSIGFLITTITVGVFSCSCSTFNTDPIQETVKSGISQNTIDISNALNAITSSPAYEVLAISNQDLTSASTASFVNQVGGPLFTDSIVLSAIAGTYELTKMTAISKLGVTLNLNSYFKQDSISPKNAMVLFFPSIRIKNLKLLLSDTLKVNNKDFKIIVTDYHRDIVSTTGQSYYNMTSSVSKNGLKLGTYKVSRTNTGSADGIKRTSANFEFDFLSGLMAKCAVNWSDTASTTTYTLTNGFRTLFEEKIWLTKAAKDLKYQEQRYSLTYGNVTLVRKPRQVLDSAQIYLNGVLQTKSKITITQNTTFSADSTEIGVISGRRKITITFDDNTSSDISSLTGVATLNKMRGLFGSLRKSYFGTYLIDQAAMNIYKVNKVGREFLKN